MSRYQFELSSDARADMKDILAYSVKTHGKATAKDYRALIKNTFEKISIDPFTPGSQKRAEISDNMRSFHINLTKETISSPIKNPRHIVFYFTLENNKLVISRILHDARDHSRHMEDMRRQVLKDAKQPEKDNTSRDNGKKR